MRWDVVSEIDGDGLGIWGGGGCVVTASLGGRSGD